MDPRAKPSLGFVGHPVTLGCIAVLLLNDHVLKENHASWLTGKVSDLAGVAMVAMILAALIGRTRAVVCTIVGFAALKLSPDVARAASPILGGVTRTDATDLIALIVLIPVWQITGRAAYPNRERRTGTRPKLALGSAVLPFVNATLAIAATTATSCAPRPAVVQVAAEQGVMFAAINFDSGNPTWAESTDGGKSWLRSDGPRRPPPNSAPYEIHTDIPPQGPTTACTGDHCWRIRERQLEHRIGDDPWTVEFALSDDGYDSISTGCTGAHQGILGSVAAAETDTGIGVVASLGANGVLARSPSGNWTQHSVLSAPPTPAGATARWLARSALYGGLLLAGGLWLAGRRGLPSLRSGLIVVGIGSVINVVVTGFAGFATPPTTSPQRVMAWVAPICLTATALISILVARRAAPSPPAPPPFPWPPPTPP